MAWIESHQSLSRHRKTIRAAGRLSVDRATLIGHLHILWWWGLDNVGADGCLGDMEPFEIAAAAEWNGDATTFVEALVDAGFLDQEEDGYYLHDWYDYAGKLIERRDAERERSRERRAARRKKRPDQTETDKKPEDDQDATEGRPTVDRATTVGTVPNRTQPNQTVPVHTDIADALSEVAVALDDPDESVGPSVVTPMAVINQACEEHIGMMSPKGLDELCSWHTERGMPVELVVEAVRIAGERGKRRPGYASGILRNWYNDGITTLEQARATQNPRGDPVGGESLLERQLREAGEL